MSKHGLPLPDKDGNYATNIAYKEIIVLHKMLKNAGIPHEFRQLFDGWQVIYRGESKAGVEASAIEHSGSYGHDDDLIELMGYLGSYTCGWMTAEEVFSRISKHWKEAHGDGE